MWVGSPTRAVPSGAGERAVNARQFLRLLAWGAGAALALVIAVTAGRTELGAKRAHAALMAMLMGQSRHSRKSRSASRRGRTASMMRCGGRPRPCARSPISGTALPRRWPRSSTRSAISATRWRAPRHASKSRQRQLSRRRRRPWPRRSRGYRRQPRLLRRHRPRQRRALSQVARQRAHPARQPRPTCRRLDRFVRPQQCPPLRSDSRQCPPMVRRRGPPIRARSRCPPRRKAPRRRSAPTRLRRRCPCRRLRPRRPSRLSVRAFRCRARSPRRRSRSPRPRPQPRPPRLRTKPWHKRALWRRRSWENGRAAAEAHRAHSSNLLPVNGTLYVIDAGDGVASPEGRN
jgi:hypothetical protein